MCRRESIRNTVWAENGDVNDENSAKIFIFEWNEKYLLFLSFFSSFIHAMKGGKKAKIRTKKGFYHHFIIFVKPNGNAYIHRSS